MTSFTASLMNLLGPELPKSPDSPHFWMPKDASVTAEPVDWLWDVLVLISTISAVAIFVVMIWFVLKYRAKSRAANETPEVTSDHNTTLEITWSIIPLVIVIALFVWGFKGYVDLRTAPRGAMTVHVTGQKWNWSFNYPNGMSDNTLHVPKDTPVRLVINSVDVLHSVFIPSFRVKMDAVPGRYTELWFKATEAGEYPIFCAEYCGTGHSDMLSKVVVHKAGGYEAWLEEQEEKQKNLPPAELGKLLYEKQGCAACHSIDGSKLVGPSLKGIWSKQEAMSDGSSVKVDENYLRESLTEPQAKIVQGFAPAMPTYKGKLSDQEITGIIEFIKSLEK